LVYLFTIIDNEYSNENILEEEDKIEEEQASKITIAKTIKTIHNLTKNLYERIMRIKDKEQKIWELSSQWKNKPMYVRDEITKFISFDERLADIKSSRCTEIMDASVEIQKLLMDIFLLFYNEPLADRDQGKLASVRSRLKRNLRTIVPTASDYFRAIILFRVNRLNSIYLN